MEAEVFETSPPRKWHQLTRAEQQQELKLFETSPYFKRLSHRLRAMIQLLM